MSEISERPSWPRVRGWLAGFFGLALLGACSSGLPEGFGTSSSSSQPSTAIGTGQVRVALILPFSASGNAGLAAGSMKNAAEMAIAEFNNPNIQLLVKDDAGTVSGAQQAAQQAVDERAEIILGPLFAQSVGAVAQVARSRNVPVIAFSTDANVAAHGVYLLSFLPESDVDRIIDYANSQGRHSFAALIPDSAYGNVVEAQFKQAVGRKGGRIVALERYPADPSQMQEQIKRVAEAARQADTVFIPDSGEAVPGIVQALVANGVSSKKVQLIGTGLWDDPRISAEPELQGAWYAAPDSAGYRSFAARYKTRYGQDPLRTATLAYDAVSLVAALVKTQGQQHFAEEILTGASGFSGVDGIFRFRPDGTNQRGLAVWRVATDGSRICSPAPHAFGAPGT